VKIICNAEAEPNYQQGLLRKKILMTKCNQADLLTDTSVLVQIFNPPVVLD